MVKDPVNPSRAELRQWAYDAEAMEPMQDFDLLVVLLGLNDLVLAFAADDQCPKQRYFLACAYLIVGDAVRTEYRSESRDYIDQFLADAGNTQHPKLLELVNRSAALIADPESFDYDDWCCGGLARRSEV
ncbi:hypothetical protein [Marinicella meishanensis]|uniref:hypothetical protein n=1 Tax=Marinicella meishanensis TaxID=2873263 RepID=UPI001CBD3834|nr:hypothetical protein [Marinicella sp. NBU2979]